MAANTTKMSCAQTPALKIFSRRTEIVPNKFLKSSWVQSYLPSLPL